jgi:predicted MPP superfamily phosphohydrolase
VTLRRPRSERLARAVIRRPYRDPHGDKGWLSPFARARRHRVVRIDIALAGWPVFKRPLRIAFLSDFHTGSHTDDVVRLTAILTEAATHTPDLVLFGGDYMNMHLTGGGRVPPHTVAAMLARLDGPLGRIAILGNHDYIYGEDDVAAALRGRGITVLDHERRTVTFEGHAIDVVGVPDAHVVRDEAKELMAALRPDRPTIVLAHDPMWFADVPAGPFLTLSGHTHGGQIKLPGVGILKNSSTAPLHWSHGLVVEGGRTLYVSAGLGTSIIPLRIGVPPEFAILDVSGP